MTGLHILGSGCDVSTHVYDLRTNLRKVALRERKDGVMPVTR